MRGQPGEGRGWASSGAARARGELCEKAWADRGAEGLGPESSWPPYLGQGSHGRSTAAVRCPRAREGARERKGLTGQAAGLPTCGSETKAAPGRPIISAARKALLITCRGESYRW